jgi:hypothetical protein
MLISGYNYFLNSLYKITTKGSKHIFMSFIVLAEDLIEMTSSTRHTTTVVLIDTQPLKTNKGRLQ